MAGYNLIQKIRRLEEECNLLGFEIVNSRSHLMRDFGDVVALVPKDVDSLPIYSRDAEVFIGSIEDLEQWLRGVEWARKYDRMLFGVKHDAKRDKQEQIYRNEYLIKTLKKAGEVVTE
jgi:hypothetical protein